MSHKPLLPDRHPTQDFFIADIFDALPVKNDRHTMEHPFFTLSTKPDIREVNYSRDGVNIILSPHHRLGLPTMMDKDILLYVGSLMMAEINQGRIPPKTIRFSAHDLMVTTNRHTNDVAYKMLKNAFERLKGCTITTNVKANGIKYASGFNIIDRWEIIESSRDKRRMVRLEVTVSDWFYNALIGKEVLTINRDYFRLRKTLERRLYELARKYCGRQPKWEIGLENLKDKCGARSPLKKFRFQIRGIIDTDQNENHFPDYQMTLNDGDKVTFTNRYWAVKQLESRQGMLPGFEALPRISDTTLRRGAQMVAEAGTGWDYGEIRAQFTEQLMEGFRPENVNGAFIGFVKSKVAKRP